jgi:hypothetical protein
LLFALNSHPQWPLKIHRHKMLDCTRRKAPQNARKKGPPQKHACTFCPQAQDLAEGSGESSGGFEVGGGGAAAEDSETAGPHAHALSVHSSELSDLEGVQTAFNQGSIGLEGVLGMRLLIAAGIWLFVVTAAAAE